MTYWTLRSLIAEWRPVLSSAAGIALAVLLVLYLDAIFRGEARQIVAFMDNTDADVWVLQEGVGVLHMTRTRLSESALVSVQRTPGVGHSVPLTYWAGLAGPRGREHAAYVVGVPEDHPELGPWRMAVGAAMPATGAVIIPAPLARSRKLALGDTFRIADREYAIGGLSLGTYAMANPLFFLTDANARDLADMSDGANVVLVWAEDGVSPDTLAARLNAEDSRLNALTAERLRADEHAVALEMGGALIRLMAIIGTAVAALIVIFCAFAFVSERRGELAVAKALGAPLQSLLAGAMLQTTVVATLGCVLALLAAGTLHLALPTLMPHVAVQFSPSFALAVSALTLATALLAAAVPSAQLLRLDATTVFK